MTPTPSQELTVERDAIARATEAFLAGGGQVQSLPSNLGPLRNMTWQEVNESRWQAKQRGDSPPKAEPRPKPLKRKRAVKKETIEKLHEARSAKMKAERDAMAPAVREMAALKMSRNKIAGALEITAVTVARIAREHDIQLPLYPRKGTNQARKNAELREEWE